MCTKYNAIVLDVLLDNLGLLNQDFVKCMFMSKLGDWFDEAQRRSSVASS